MTRLLTTPSSLEPRVSPGQVYLLGFLFDWRTTCWICSCGPLLLSLAMWWCWETPYWLVEQGRGEEARASLQWYRGPHYDTTLEIEEIVRSWEQKQVRCDWSRAALISDWSSGSGRRASWAGWAPRCGCWPPPPSCGRTGARARCTCWPS